MNAIKIPNKASISTKKDKTTKGEGHFLPPDTVKQIAEILGPIALQSDTLQAHRVAITGTMEIFDTQANLTKWLEEHGAKVDSSVQRGTTHLIKGATHGIRSNQLEKDARFWKSKGTKITTLSEVVRLAELSPHVCPRFHISSKER